MSDSAHIAVLVGEHIKKRRLLLKLTQNTVASLLNVSQFSTINWERGDFQCSNVFTLHRIIEFLGYDLLTVRPFRGG